MGFKDAARKQFSRFFGEDKDSPSGRQGSTGQDPARNNQNADSGDEVDYRKPEDGVSYVNKLHDQWYQIRYPYEPTWYLDVAHYLGLQWHTWFEGQRTLRQTPAPSYRVRMVINKIYPGIRTLLGKFLRGVPSAIASPTDTTDVAKAEARVCERLLRALWPHLHMFHHQMDVLLWGLLTGTGFFKTTWDPSLGDYITDEEGRPMYTGDMCVQALGPFGIFVPPYQTNLYDPSKVLEVKAHPLSVIKARFPDAAKNLTADFTVDANSIYEERMASLVSPLTSMQARSGAQRVPAVNVKELWEDPQTLTEEAREQFPKGRLTIVANKMLMFSGSNPFADAKHPYDMFRGAVFPSRFWGMSHVEQSVPIQKAYNKSRSQMMEARNLNSAPKVVAEQGHGVIRMTNEPGSWWEYRKGWKEPKYVEPPQINQWMTQDLDRQAQEFQDTFMVREVGRGELPAANLTGVGINLLQEADNTPWGPTATEYALCLSGVMQKLTNRAYQGYIEPRMMTAVDELDPEDVMEFYSSGELAPVKVECDLTSVMPDSQTARQVKVEGLVKLGVLDPIRDRSRIIRMVEFGTADELQLQADPDHHRAQRENKRMKRGIPHQIMQFDDDAIHLQDHTDFMKTAEFEAMSPDQQGLFYAGVQQHQQKMLMDQQQQLMAQQMMTAPPAPVGGASPGGTGLPPPPAGPTGAPPPGGGPPPMP